MRILVPLDGSIVAERAIPPALQMLARSQEPHELVLLHVVPLLAPPNDADLHLASDHRAILVRASKRYLNTVKRHYAASGVTITLRVTGGAPAQEICRQANALAADLIVVTHHERSPLEQLEHGSIAEQVARDASISTLLVRETGETFPEFCRYVPLTLLVPFNGPLLTDTPLTPAVELARAFDGAIRLLYILPPSAGEYDADQVADEQAHMSLSVIQASLQRQGIMTYCSLAWGDPTGAVRDMTEHHPVDLIVLADTGFSGMLRIQGSSLIDEIVQRLGLPVLVMRPLAPSLAMLTPAASALSQV